MLACMLICLTTSLAVTGLVGYAGVCGSLCRAGSHALVAYPTALMIGLRTGLAAHPLAEQSAQRASQECHTNVDHAAAGLPG